MFKNLNRGISTLLAIGIIAVLVIVVGGGILAYQYYYITEKEQAKPPTTAVETPKTEKVDFSVLNKDDLLHKLFPNLSFKNGVADLSTEDIAYRTLKLHLKDSVEDYFINTQEKSLLLIANLDGVAHAGGLYHAYLGLFDKNGNLLTPSSVFPEPNGDNSYGDDYYDFHSDKAQFGGDQGEFGFYDCHGINYILFVSHGCSTGSCCSGNAKLFRINNGNFEDIQIIDRMSLTERETNLLSIVVPFANASIGPSYDLRMILSGDKILVKKVPPTSGSGCPETNYKELKWNKNSCRFE